jgi:hypothetical protein
VLYGAINVISGDVTATLAYHSNTSDDFSPSIGVSAQGSNTVAVWLNWAYTDTPAGRPVSDTINGVFPGNGVPNLAGTDHAAQLRKPSPRRRQGPGTRT